MAGYRFYFVNRAGRIVSARESECDDDREAERTDDLIHT